jgi:hypothetical protein
MFLITVNAVTLLLAIVTTVFFILLMNQLKAWLNTGWWTLLPLAFAYVTVNRFFILYISMGGLPSEQWSEVMAAATLPFWAMMSIFAYGLCFTVMKTKRGG